MRIKKTLDKEKRMQSLGLKIRARREELGLSQKDVADKLGIQQTKVSDIEQGKRGIDLIDELPKLSQLLKQPLYWFTEETGSFQDKPFEAFIRNIYPNASASEVIQCEAVAKTIIDAYFQSKPQTTQDILGRVARPFNQTSGRGGGIMDD